MHFRECDLGNCTGIMTESSKLAQVHESIAKKQPC